MSNRILLRRLLFVLATIFFTACASVTDTKQPSVTIYRDDWGVPHIYADREEYGFYGLGYAQAEDQLIKLLGAVYWVHGRRAELEGEALLAVDIEQRRWRHAGEGRGGFGRLDPQVQENYRQYLAGLNRYMADYPDKVPAWAPQIEVADLVAFSRAVFWAGYAAVLGPGECKEPDVELHASIIDAGNQQLKGASNGWVVAPARTANGATILLADPHTELQSAAYYEYRMQAGQLDSAGFSLGPLLWQAHNKDVSWAMTTGNPDMWDCYAVEVDPANPARYLYDGKWQDMLQVEETFQVRDSEPVTEVFEYTRHNDVLSPVVARRDGKAYVVSTSQMHDTGLLDNEIWQMNQAESVFDLQDAMGNLGMFPQNIIAGDFSGNIWYLRAGKTPVRPDGYDFTKPVPGNDSATAWQGYYALEDMVQVLNPPQNFLQNNNVAPDRLFPSKNLQASDYPTGIFNDIPGRVTTRGLRSIEVLSGTEQFTLADAMAHAFDETWITAEYWSMALSYALEQYPHWLEDNQGEAGDLVLRLRDFNGVAAADSKAALNFYYWRSGMYTVLSRPEFEHLRTLPWSREDFSPDFATALLEQASHAATTMVDQLGSTDVAMGEVFRVGRGEQSWPLGGETIDTSEISSCVADLSPLCERTMRAFASGKLNEQGQRRAYRGSQSMRLVEFTDPVRSWSLHVYGQSDDPESKHYDDQARLLSEGRFKPAYFSRDELEGHIESTTILKLGVGASGNKTIVGNVQALVQLFNH